MDDDFGAYVAQSSDRFVRAAWVMLGPLHREAEDVVQETLASVFTRWTAVSREPSARDAYVYKAMVRAARRHARRAYFRKVDLAGAVPDQSGEDGTAVVDHALEVRRLLTTLPARQREATILHYLLDLPVEQVAKVMGCSVGTVKSQLSKARTAIATAATRQINSEGRC